MQDVNQEYQRKKGPGGIAKFIWALFLTGGGVLIAVGWYWYGHKEISIPNPSKINELIAPAKDKIASIISNDRNQETISIPPAPATSSQSPQTTKDVVQKNGEAKPLSEISTSSPAKESEDAAAKSDDWQNSPPPSNEALLKNINTFYAHLDRQQYLQTYHLKTSSRLYFSQLLQKLLDNPPVVVRETDDLFTLLKNTAHFFRILGKDNITMLKAILHQEKDSFEETLRSFYLLTYHPEYIEKEYNIKMSLNALQDYAGFFLNTMGGKMYLFRRDSSSRLLVSYYSILVIDRAQDTGDERHGIDLKPAINNLIDEMENGGGRLKLRENYLDTLYDLKQKYQ